VRAFVIRSVLGRLRELSVPVEPLAPAVDPGRRVTSPVPTPAVHRPPQTPTGTKVDPVTRPTPVPVDPIQVKPAPSVAPPKGTCSTTGRATGGTPGWRFLGLAHGNFALFETKSGLVLLDRRAAHERIWFERLQEQFRGGQVPSQRLLLPVPMELDPIATALLLDRLEFLVAHGFEVSEFGRNFFRIEALPTWMEPADAEPFMRDMLGLLREGRFQGKNLDLAREELARLAVAKAVRLPETASETEVRALLTQLFATRHPLTSPGGRPTYIELNHAELARRFQKLT